ncbi:MAG: thymidine kinase [Candidatus Njordarchaeia archaeon]
MGSIIVITGPMFSGKTTELIRHLERAIYAKRRGAIFKPSLDNRYSEKEVVSHNGLRYPAIVVPNTIEGVAEIYNKAHDLNLDVVCIDEAQFFPIELVDLVEKLASENKVIIVAGLNLDFRGEPFETIKEILVRADDITHLKAVCTVCGADATRTQRLINGKPAPYDSPRILIGGSEVYEARCRKHHVVPRGEVKEKRSEKAKN